jgi:DNA-binding CsgD family transcriptional regulator
MNRQLSTRERQVLELAAKGHTDDMIASELGIETGTVNSYWVRVRGKLGHLSRTHLVANFVQGQADIEANLQRTAAVDAIEVARQKGERLADELAKSRKQFEEHTAIMRKLSEDHTDAMSRANEEIKRLKMRLSDSGDSAD